MQPPSCSYLSDMLRGSNPAFHEGEEMIRPFLYSQALLLILASSAAGVDRVPKLAFHHRDDRLDQPACAIHAPGKRPRQPLAPSRARCAAMPRKLAKDAFDVQHLITKPIVGFAVKARIAQESSKWQRPPCRCGDGRQFAEVARRPAVVTLGTDQLTRQPDRR